MENDNAKTKGKNDNEIRSFRFFSFFLCEEKFEIRRKMRRRPRLEGRSYRIARGKGRGARVTGTPGIRVNVRKVKRR